MGNVCVVLSGHSWVFPCHDSSPRSRRGENKNNWLSPKQHPVTSLTAFMFPVSCSLREAWFLSVSVLTPLVSLVTPPLSVVASLVTVAFSPVGVVTYDSSARFRRGENFRFTIFKAFILTFTFGAAFAN